MVIPQMVIQIQQIMYKILNVKISSSSFLFNTFFSKITHKKVISYYLHLSSILTSVPIVVIWQQIKILKIYELFQFKAKTSIYVLYYV